MLELKGIVKKYGRRVIIKDATGTFEDGGIYGLAGYNGVGKTTLLKTMAGIYRPEDGEILYNGEKVTDHPDFRASSFLMTEELFFNPQSTIRKMREFYKGYYKSWDDQIYHGMLKFSGLDETAPIVGFSKGMQRQAGLLLAISTAPHFLFLDETFDGLDVVRRELLSKILKIYAEVRNALIIVTSHYLDELEKLVDQVYLIEEGVLASPDIRGKSLETYFTEKMEVSDEEIRTVFSSQNHSNRINQS